MMTSLFTLKLKLYLYLIFYRIVVKVDKSAFARDRPVLLLTCSIKYIQQACLAVYHNLLSVGILCSTKTILRNY